MRIDLYNSAASQIASDLNSQPVSSSGGGPAVAGAGGVSGGDRTSLSSGAAAVASLVSTALSSPAVRLDRVDSLRQAIQGGQYQIEPSSIAASMVGEAH